MSNGCVATGTTLALPSILVTPPSPPISVSSIGSCGDLLVGGDTERQDKEEESETLPSVVEGSLKSAPYDSSVDGELTNGDFNVNRHGVGANERSGSLVEAAQKGRDDSGDGDGQKECQSEDSIQLGSVDTDSSSSVSNTIAENKSNGHSHGNFDSDSSTCKRNNDWVENQLHSEIKRDLDFSRGNYSSSSWSGSHAINSSGVINATLEGNTIPVSGSNISDGISINKNSSTSEETGHVHDMATHSDNIHRDKDSPAIAISGETEHKTNKTPEFSLRVDLAFSGSEHRPDFTDVFPVDEIPLAGSPETESFSNFGRGVNFLQACHGRTNHHFLTPNTSHHHGRSSPTPNAHHHHPTSPHLQHLQHLLIGNGHSNHHHQQHQHLHHQSHQQHHHHHSLPQHQQIGGGNEGQPNDSIPQYSSELNLRLSGHGPSHNSDIAASHSLPALQVTNHQAVENSVTANSPDASQKNTDDSPSPPSKPKVKLEVMGKTKSLEFPIDDDDFDLDQCSPRPRLSSMEPGTRKTDFKFRRPKKLNTTS